MYRIIHSADWQLGARFSQFGQHGNLLRQARLDTLQRTLILAREHQTDAFPIAGDPCNLKAMTSLPSHQLPIIESCT